MNDEIGPDGKTPDDSNARASKGRARIELGKGGKTVAVHVDRQGFRRLLQTLEKLAATGERQTFEKSGRRRAGAKGQNAGDGTVLDKLVFHIDDSDR